ncbi:MAG: PAS domain-containing protein [Hyphomicrobiales bacterium]|nr:PAS domain-containing protein [Hyphomicrobiales bacterium]
MSQDSRSQESEREEPALVMIGASAGGVQALTALFGALPPKTGAAFVVIVHLDPQRRSDLDKIIASQTSLPVTQVEGRQRLEGDHIYVIPPDRRLQLIDHEVSAEPFDEPRGQRAPIDLFFRSAAARLGDGFAVILSGGGSDGAIGARAVKEAGGIILAQEPTEAEHGSMPHSAIATGIVDFVLPVRQLAHKLAELIEIKRAARDAAGDRFDEDILRRVLAHVRVRTGHDFSKYKQATVLRRIARRMQVCRTDDLQSYYDHLRDDPAEAQTLLSDLLISVTTFFRDGEAFQALSRHVLPALFGGKEDGEPLRVWSCGCATGEEAYSLAILLLEEASRHARRPQIQVFGSDLDSRAVALARDGRFPTAIEADVSEDRLLRYFLKEGEHYRIRQEVCDIVLFAVHDLLKDPPFSHVDLIACRNVLIYLDRDLQEQVCNTLHYALNPAGYLLLGNAETADHPPGLFRMIDRGARLYQSTAKVGERPRHLALPVGPVRLRHAVTDIGRPTNPTMALGEAVAHRRALETHAPPSILVDEAYRVTHLSDNAGRYLKPTGGPLSGDVADLARPELRFELRSSLSRAFEQQRPSLSLPIPVQFNGAPRPVLLMVKPIVEDGAARQALVIFIEGDAVAEAPPLSDRQASDEMVRRLIQELELTQARLRTVREESEAANEEIRATNEELQSINEEYRSTSEELETSKEELQSINEELQTVNTELKLKLEAISRAHSDVQNLMAATDFGTLFLDVSLCIKRFTDRVTEIFSITPADEGRPITDFSHTLEYGGLVRDIRSVLADLVPIRREIQSSDGRWHDVRMRPYRTVDNKIDGVVLTFVDITERLHAEGALRASEQRLLQLKRLIDLSREAIIIWSLEDGVIEWNRGCEELYGYQRSEALGQASYRLLQSKAGEAPFDTVKTLLQEHGSWIGELQQRAKDGQEVMVESRIELLTVDDRRLVFESSRNIADRKNWEYRQQLLLSELAHRVKNILTVVQAIAHQTLRNSGSHEEFIERFDGRLLALGKAHGLLVESQWRGADLATLIREQIGALVGRIVMEGPAVLLPPRLATPFALVLHELATNAVKHGSLSQPAGDVRLAWSLSGDEPQTLHLEWRERGDSPTHAPQTAGFGSTLIGQGIAGATVQREFGPQGLVCRISVPLSEAKFNGLIV